MINGVNIFEIRAFIKSDPHCTYEIIKPVLQTSERTKLNIINNRLKLKISSRWISHELNEKNRKN
jgi:hypothetical protein